MGGNVGAVSAAGVGAGTSARPRRAARGFAATTGVLLAGVVAAATVIAVQRATAVPQRAVVSPVRLVTYVDRPAGLSIGIPVGWTRLGAGNSGADLIARSADGMASMLLRSVPLAHAVNPAHPRAVQAVVATILDTSHVHVVVHERTRMGGLPGIAYVYTFHDRASGQLALHCHYFLFDGRRLQILVLQLLPAAALRSVAPTFGAIARSVRTV